MKKPEIDKWLKRSDIVIEGSTAKWDISLSGEHHGLYTGTFRFKCYLPPTEKLAASREYRELLGTNPSLASQHEDNLAFSLSQLKYRILAAPPFWTASLNQSGYSGDIPDENVIEKVLDAAVAAELKYIATIKHKRAEVLEKAKIVAEKIAENEDEEGGESESQDQKNAD